MRYKILIFLIVLAVVLLLGNYVTGRIIAGLLDDVIHQQAETHLPEAEVEYDRIGVNPLLSRVYLDNIHLANRNSFRFQNRRAGIHLSIRDILKAIRSDEPLTEIKSFKITFEQGEWEDKVDRRTLDFANAEWQFHGNMGRLFSPDGRLIAADDAQRILFTLNRPVFTNFFDQTPVADLIDPVPESQSFRRVSGVLQYNPDDGITYLRPLNLESENLDIMVNGEFTYPETPHGLLQPADLKFTFNTESEPGETVFKISEEVGRLSARSASISGEAHYSRHADQTWESGHYDITYALSSPVLLPSDQLQQEHGTMFQAFGIDTSRLPARRWSGNITNSGSDIAIRDNQIETAYFDVGINLLLTTAEPGENTVEDGRLRVYNQSTAFREFLDDIEALSGIDLKREDEELLIRFHGPPGNLNFDFGEAER